MNGMIFLCAWIAQHPYPYTNNDYQNWKQEFPPSGWKADYKVLPYIPITVSIRVGTNETSFHSYLDENGALAPWIGLGKDGRVISK